MMRTYLTRKEHEAAGDYSEPVTIRGKLYRIVMPPVFEELRDTAVVDAILIDDVFSMRNRDDPMKFEV